MNHMIDQNDVCTTNGSARASTSRPPHGRDHQLVGSGLRLLAASVGTRVIPTEVAEFGPATRDNGRRVQVRRHNSLLSSTRSR